MTTTSDIPAGQDPVPTPIRTLLDVFAADLSAVAFPDVDGRVLAEAAERVRQAAAEVVTRETALAEAQAALQGAQDALLGKAQRALAYARVFAEDNAPLTGKLDAVTLPRGPRRARGETVVAAPSEEVEAPPRRRGRPKASGLLFVDDQARAAAAEG